MKSAVVLIVIGVVCLGTSHCDKFKGSKTGTSQSRSVGQAKAHVSNKQGDNSLVFDGSMFNGLDSPSHLVKNKALHTGKQEANQQVSDRISQAIVKPSIEMGTLNSYDNEYYSKQSFFRADMFNDTDDFGEAILYQIKDFPTSHTKMIDASLYKMIKTNNQWFQTHEAKIQPYCGFIQRNSLAKYVMKFTNVDVNVCPEPKGEWRLTELFFPPHLSRKDFVYPSKWKAIVNIYDGEKPILSFEMIIFFTKVEDK